MTAMEHAIEWAKRQHLEIVGSSILGLTKSQVWAEEWRNGAVAIVDRASNVLKVFYTDF